MNRILIRDLYNMTNGKTFELTIKKREVVTHKNGSNSLLTILVNKILYKIWEPKNRVWQRFRTQVGRGLIAEVGRFDGDKFFIKPIEQLISIQDTNSVLDLYELPFTDGSYTLGVGIVSSTNKTQYLYLLDDSGKHLVRIPSGWENHLNSLQYTVIDVNYKRTAMKGFLTLNGIVGSLEVEDIDKFFM